MKALCLMAANGDPLRAQEIWEKVTPEWWSWWMLDKTERVRKQISDMEKSNG